MSTVPDADRFEIEQLIRPMVNLYRISCDHASSAVAFVRQKRIVERKRRTSVSSRTRTRPRGLFRDQGALE